MINTNNMDALEWLRKHLDEDGNDLVREMVTAFAEKLMGAEVDALCGAGYGEVSADRVNSRNGYRDRRWDTRAGTVELAIPKLREGSYFPRTTPPGREGARCRCCGRVPARCVDTSGRQVGADDGHRRDLQVPGVADGGRARRDGHRVPQPPTTAPTPTCGPTR